MPRAKTANYKLDMMSITVLLVMAIFGGVVGYYIGRASLSPFMAGARDTATMMQTTGQMMEQRAARYKDEELKMAGQKMIDWSNSMTKMMTAY